MTTQTVSPEAKVDSLHGYEFTTAVGVIVPGATILYPSVAEHPDGLVYETDEDAIEDNVPFTLTHEGELTGMRKFGNRYGIHDLDDTSSALVKNTMVGLAIHQLLGEPREEPRDFASVFRKVVPRLGGAFSIIAKQGSNLFVARDRFGIGTMFVGEIESGGMVVSSQEASLEALNAQTILELEPGTLACVGQTAVQHTRWAYPVHLR